MSTCQPNNFLSFFLAKAPLHTLYSPPFTTNYSLSPFQTGRLHVLYFADFRCSLVGPAFPLRQTDRFLVGRRLRRRPHQWCVLLSVMILGEYQTSCNVFQKKWTILFFEYGYNIYCRTEDVKNLFFACSDVNFFDRLLVDLEWLEKIV